MVWMEINESELSEVPKTDNEALESRPTKKVKKGQERSGKGRRASRRSSVSLNSRRH